MHRGWSGRLCALFSQSLLAFVTLLEVVLSLSLSVLKHKQLKMNCGGEWWEVTMWVVEVKGGACQGPLMNNIVVKREGAVAPRLKEACPTVCSVSEGLYHS